MGGGGGGLEGREDPEGGGNHPLRLKKATLETAHEEILHRGFRCSCEGFHGEEIIKRQGDFRGFEGFNKFFTGGLGGGIRGRNNGNRRRRHVQNRMEGEQLCKTEIY